jgi:hypothetical protein
MTKLRTILLTLAFALAGLAQPAAAQVLFHGGVAGPNTVFGWNYFHIAACSTAFDGATTWFYVYSQEGGYGVTNNPLIINSVSPACQSRQIVGVYVTSLVPFRWSSIVVYPN